MKHTKLRKFYRFLIHCEFLNLMPCEGRFLVGENLVFYKNWKDAPLFMVSKQHEKCILFFCVILVYCNFE
jgi:hypothetical protein